MTTSTGHLGKYQTIYLSMKAIIRFRVSSELVVPTKSSIRAISPQHFFVG